ncbi:MAG TPA: hypothetical protein VM925_34410, partial [Labilithrix sp.]|nr:hypothetical protein [Labilithrix sp.]
MRIRSSDPSTALGPPDSDGPLSVRPAPETIPPASSVRSSTIAASIPTLHRANALLETRRRGETALGVTDEQNATLTSIAQWSKDYLTRPHPMLGRTGHVCPWVDASMRTGCYYITLLETNDEDEIERVFLRLQAYFLKMEPRDARDAQLKTIVVVFPTIDDVAAPSFITRVHARLK